ncbi:MAG TPA: T9SS type A sorting domain-containing protein [Ignavibacteria bacterium]|nr:hypothetical protein [Bacteroidota bacterium]HRI85362.1 T9SS type A sorting domain-containing protein [Ignavibacteria bacterium]HRJ99753.1 T9SS type A sorting domain-containing protein [Ignavibacteria bacterium]
MIKKILIFLIPIVLVFAYGFKPKDKPDRSNTVNSGNTPYRILPNQVSAVTSVKLEANQISTWFRTNGSFNRNPTTGNSGFEWPKGQSKFARYASGIWIGARVLNPQTNQYDTLLCIAEYDYEYLPGNIPTLGGSAVGNTDDNFRIYNISSTDTSDYGPWRTIASQQGAYLDSLDNPLLLGSQTQFYSYTDGYPEAHANNAGSTAPLKAVILQTNWSYAVNGPLSSMSFSEFRIINRSNQPWEQCYIALWTDDDLGVATDDAVSVDTLLDLGITYNFTNNDGEYGAAPPAVGFDYFRGPIVPSVGDTVKYFSPPGSNNLVVKPDFRELGVTAFNMYTNGNPSVGDPSNRTETYRNLRGLRRDGTPWINPQTNQVTTYAFSGNPESQTGWNEADAGDRRFMQCSGPITVQPGDTQSIVVAQVIARGSSNLESVRALKQADALAQRIFDNNFQVPDAAPCPTVLPYAPGNGKIYLSWDDKAERTKIPNKLSGGEYKFQGYNIYAVKTGTNGSNEADRKLIMTFDVKDGIGDIQDSVFQEQFGTYVYYTVQKGTNNGISRYIVIDKDNINNLFIVSGTPYSFAVTAYFYDALGGPFSAPKVNESPITSCVLTVIPQQLTSGTQVNYGLGDTVYTNQRDLGVMPLIVEPLNLITADYTTTYGGTTANPTWSLDRIIGGSTERVLSDQLDFTGTQDTAKTINGFLLVHQTIRDSGIVRDPDDLFLVSNNIPTYSRQRGWTYEPSGNIWFRGPDTTAIKTAKLITNRQFDSRSLGMSFPTQGRFNNFRSRITANGVQFNEGTGANTLMTGGPLRKVQFVFGETSKAYRYAPAVNVLQTDTNLSVTPYKDMVDVPFSVYSADELDSTGGALRRLNIAFIDSDADGLWNPDESSLGKYQFTYVLTSSYSETPNANYVSRGGQAINPGSANPTFGFTAMDVMYAWLPRLATAGSTWTSGDKLTVYPYRITRPNFVPSVPIKYSWKVEGTQTGNTDLAKNQMNNIKVFPNPYYGGHSLETDPFNRFIYFSNLPSTCTIYIYTLSGVLVRKISRSNSDPNNSLEQWNLQNEDQIPVASGMYVVFVDGGSLGSKTLKIAIFTPTERIQTF